MTDTAKQGEAAPDFELATDGGGRVRLSEHRGHPVVLYFYPKDDTSGCTRQALDFSQMRDHFEQIGVRLIGISPDDPGSHDRFKAKHGLAMTLASDTDKTVLKAYGVWKEKSMYGRRYMGVERSTFLIDGDGRIARIWRDVKVPGHAQDVLDSARLIGSW